MSFGPIAATVILMSDEVKTRRRYESALRREQSSLTRERIVDAATRLFTRDGYAAVSVGRIAAEAGVAVDTLYALVGRKPALLREVVEVAISGGPGPVPADERAYVRRVREAPTAEEKLRIYAQGVAEMSPRTGPVFTALRDAGRLDAECAALDREIADRRAANMLRFAADLRSTGQLRADLSDAFVADVVWATAGALHYTELAVGRGWTAAEFGDYLIETWSRLLLAPA